MKFSFSAVVLSCLLLLPVAAQAKYTYLHSEGEYSVDLPEAPRSTTIWADKGDIPYLSDAPAFGSLGEIATYRRVDPETGDFFDAKITFVKAEKDALLKLTEDGIKQILENDFSALKLDSKQVSVSAGDPPLKWGVLTGVSVDPSNRILFNTEHFITGLGSITVIRVQYSAENKTFESQYQDLVKSIKFAGR